MDSVEFDRQIYQIMQIPNDNRERRYLVLEALALLYSGPQVARKALKDFVAKNPQTYKMQNRDVYKTRLADILIVMPLKHLRIIINSIRDGLNEADRKVEQFYHIHTRDYNDI